TSISDGAGPAARLPGLTGKGRMTSRVFLLGAGYSARAYARLLAGRAVSVAGTTRSPERAEALRFGGIAPVPFDGTAVSADMAAALSRTTHLLLSAAPDEAGDPLLRL